MLERLERLAPLSGVVFVVLYAVGTAFVVPDSPDFVDDPREYVPYYVDNQNRILGGGVLFLLAGVALLWFLGSIRRRGLEAEGGDARVTSLGFGGGAVGVAMWFAAAATLMLPALRLDNDQRLTEEFAVAMMDLSSGFVGIAAPMGFAVLLVAVGLLGLRHGAVPAWWAWISLVLGVVLLVPPISWAGMFFAFPVWVLVMVALLVRGTAGSPARLA